MQGTEDNKDPETTNNQTYRIRSIILLPSNRNREMEIRKSGRNDGTDFMATLHYSLKNAKGTVPSSLEAKNVGSGG